MLSGAKKAQRFSSAAPLGAGEQLPLEDHRNYFRDDFRDKRLADTKQAIAVRLDSVLAIPLLAKITTGKSTFSIPEAFNKPGVYIFNLSQSALTEPAMQILGRLILSMLQAAAYKRGPDKQTEDNIPTRNHVFVDECGLLCNETSGKIAAQTRKYGLMLFFIQQFFGQDIDARLMENIMTNTPLKITGVGQRVTYQKVAASQQVDVEGFSGIRPRRFHIARRGGAMPFLATASSDLAGQSLRMTPAEWHTFRETQLQRYYRSATAKPPEAPARQSPALPSPQCRATCSRSPAAFPTAPSGVTSRRGDHRHPRDHAQGVLQRSAPAASACG